MKNKLLSILGASFLGMFSTTATFAQSPLYQKDVHVVLKNSISNEVKSFLTSDTIVDRSKFNYLNLASGLSFFGYNEIPANLKKAFLDPIAYGLDPLKSEFVRYIPDSNIVSNILIFQIQDFKRFKSKFEGDNVVNFTPKNGMIELYNNTAFIKENRLVYIFSEENNKRSWNYGNPRVQKSNFVEALESSFSFYCTEAEAEKLTNTQPHLRVDPDYPDSPIPTIAQVKESRKYGLSDYNDYNYYTENAEVDFSGESEDELYGVESSIFNYSFEPSSDPLSFYKGYKKQISDADTVEEYDDDESVEVVEEAVVVADSAAVDYAYADEGYEYDQDYYSDPYKNLSKRDQKKIKKLKAKELKILAKSKADKNLEDEVEIVDEVVYEETTAAYDDGGDESYHSFKYYKLCELFDNKKYVAPFLNGNYTFKVDKKSFTDFKSSKASTAIWVNQEGLTQMLLKDIVSNFRLEDKIAVNENTYLKDCAMLIEMDYTQKNKSIVTLKGFGNKEYLKDIKSVFATNIPSNWLANVPEKTALVTGLAVDNLKLASFYKNYLYSTFASSKDTLVKEYFNLMQVFLDEEAIAKSFNGKSLFYVVDTVKYTKQYRTYEYDSSYEYRSVMKSKEVVYPSFAFFIGSDDKTAFQSYINLTQYFGYLTEENGIYTVYFNSVKHNKSDSPVSDEHIYMSFINNALVVSNDMKVLKSIINNKSTNSTKLTQQLEQNKIYLKMDFSNATRLLKQTEFGENDKMVKYFSQFEKIELNGLDFDENKFTLKLNFEQKPTGKNQIETIFDLFNF